MRVLTERQNAVAECIIAYQSEHGMSPTMQEIADRLNVSKVTVHEHVSAMERRGFLIRQPHLSRSIVLIDNRITSLPTAVLQQLIDSARQHDAKLADKAAKFI